MCVSMYAIVYMRRSGYKHSGLTSFPLPHGSHPGIELCSKHLYYRTILLPNGGMDL